MTKEKAKKSKTQRSLANPIADTGTKKTRPRVHASNFRMRKPKHEKPPKMFKVAGPFGYETEVTREEREILMQTFGWTHG